MRGLQRVNLLDQIGRELQSRMTYSDIDVYLGTFGVDCKDFTPSTNSKWVYVKELLAKADQELLLNIADDLDIEHNHSRNATKEPTFWKTGYFRLFLSHLASFKVQTSRLQTVLQNYAITGFVAHEDIEPSKEWQMEIETALHTMDAFTPILMPGFKESNWCDQEVGFAVSKDLLVIPVRKGLDPYGFIGKYQGIQANEKSIGDVANSIFLTIVNSHKTRNKMIRCLSNAISQSTDIEKALEKIILFHTIEEVSSEQINNLVLLIKDNKLLINSEIIIAELNKILSFYSMPEVKLGGLTEPEPFNEDIPF